MPTTTRGPEKSGRVAVPDAPMNRVPLFKRIARSQQPVSLDWLGQVSLNAAGPFVAGSKLRPRCLPAANLKILRNAFRMPGLGCRYRLLHRAKCTGKILDSTSDRRRLDWTTRASPCRHELLSRANSRYEFSIHRCVVAAEAAFACYDWSPLLRYHISCQGFFPGLSPFRHVVFAMGMSLFPSRFF